MRNPECLAKGKVSFSGGPYDRGKHHRQKGPKKKKKKHCQIYRNDQEDEEETKKSARLVHITDGQTLGRLTGT